MTDAQQRTALAAVLEQAAQAARAGIAAGAPAGQFRRQVIPALATLETLARQVELADADLRIAMRACGDAAAACRTEPPDEDVVRLCGVLEGVVSACAAALEPELPPRSASWQRFLFRDADVEVRRRRRRWSVRAVTGVEAEETFLDAALAHVLPVSSHRLAEITVQILDWFEHDAPFST